MTAKITELIDKKDTIELLRDYICTVLLTEIANQKILAIAAGQNPDNYSFDIYKERSSPWELIENIDGEVIRQMPLVNVYIENATNDESKGDPTGRHLFYNVTINIDCLSAKNNRTVDGVQQKGDQRAAEDVQRVARLVRNILMSAYYLKMEGLVSSRKIDNITMFQPNINDRPAQHCIGCRLVYSASVDMPSPQADGPDLELISGTTTNEEGQVLFSLDVDTTEET